MSTSTNLKQNIKPVIRKRYKGKTLSVNIQLDLSKRAKIKNGDYIYSYLDNKNRLIFERVNIKEEEEEE
jgi:hypothetical protein